jgi:hypothetical protein
MYAATIVQASVPFTHPAPELNGCHLAIPVQGLFGSNYIPYRIKCQAENT